jgi:hypothetical protein
LGATIAGWREDDAPAARLGFLDPDNYRTGRRVGPQTSSADHRSWLATLKAEGSTLNLAVHFSGDPNTPHRRAAIALLHADGVACGYAATRAFQSNHYVVSVNFLDPAGEAQTLALADELEQLVRAAWATWFAATASRKERRRELVVIVNGKVRGYSTSSGGRG